MNTMITLLAQTTQPGPTPGQPGGQMNFLFPALMIGLVAFMLLSARSQKKREKRERDDMYARLARNDRVLTIGGAIGTIISVKDNEVVLKVDESTNTKMTFIKTAVQRIITNDQDLSAEKK
jgi:preprotein translocase subunit YajC